MIDFEKDVWRSKLETFVKSPKSHVNWRASATEETEAGSLGTVSASSNFKSGDHIVRKLDGTACFSTLPSSSRLSVLQDNTPNYGKHAL